MARKRRPGTKKQSVAVIHSSPERSTIADSEPVVIPGQGDIILERRRNKARNMLSFVTSYIGDILRIALWLLKKPLGLVTFVLLLVIALDFVIDKSRSVLTPLCALPIPLLSAICSRRTTAPLDVRRPKTADFARLVELQDGFSGIMDMNADTSEIGLKLKQSEIATRDLVTLVGVSDLENRDALVKVLLQFVDDARKVGDGLHRLCAKIDGAVDRITIVNDYALRTIRSASDRAENVASRTALQSALGVSHGTEDAILSSFHDAMGVLARETQRTLLEASLNVANLERLQERLVTIHELCSREGVALSAAHTELLSELWTVLGGNRQARRKNEIQLALLGAVDRYRQVAHLHVALTREALQAIAADVEELRERAAAPEVIGEHIPPEVLIAFIGQGIERLQEGRRKESERRQALMHAISGGPMVLEQILSIESEQMAALAVRPASTSADRAKCLRASAASERDQQINRRHRHEI